MDDNRLDISDEPSLDNQPPSCANQLPFNPNEWDTALASFLNLPDDWADDIKREYDDPVADLICAGLPNAYIGSDPAEIEMNYASLTDAVNDMDDERLAAVQQLARVALSEFFDPRGTLKHVHNKAKNTLASATPSFERFRQAVDSQTESTATETDLQNALASLNDPDSPLRREWPNTVTTTHADTEETPAYIFKHPPREGDALEINIGTEYEVRVRIEDVAQFRQNDVLRTILTVSIVDSIGEEAPEVGEEATVLPQSLSRRAEHHPASED